MSYAHTRPSDDVIRDMGQADRKMEGVYLYHYMLYVRMSL